MNRRYEANYFKMAPSGAQNLPTVQMQVADRSSLLEYTLLLVLAFTVQDEELIASIQLDVVGEAT